MMRVRVSVVLLVAILIPQSWADEEDEASNANWFVKTRGVQLVLNGKPFYANGFNAYWLMYFATDPSQRYKISDTFREASSRSLTVVRTWAFSDGGYRPLQISPGSYDENTFRGLDFVISEARKYGLKLILSLVNNYESFGGKKQYVQWGREQGQYLTSDDDFYTNPVVKDFYKNHITTVLNRYNTFTKSQYKKDLIIMAWELMNEPSCASDPSGRTVQAWITEMAAHVKSMDTNHLLEVGLEGFYGDSSPERKSVNPYAIGGTDFIANNRIPGIDFATVHSYPDQWLPNASEEAQMDFLNKWADAHIEDAQNVLRKPIILAEFGKSFRTPGFSVEKRDKMYGTLYGKIYESAKRDGAAAGGLVWQLLGDGMESIQDGYGLFLREQSSTLYLISEQSKKLVAIHKILV